MFQIKNSKNTCGIQSASTAAAAYDSRRRRRSRRKGNKAVVAGSFYLFYWQTLHSFTSHIDRSVSWTDDSWPTLVAIIGRLFAGAVFLVVSTFRFANTYVRVFLYSLKNKHVWKRLLAEHVYLVIIAIVSNSHIHQTRHLLKYHRDLLSKHIRGQNL